MTEAFAHRVDTLRAAQTRLEAAQAEAGAAAIVRDQQVRAGVADGMTHAEISRATGLTRARIGQIALQGKASKEKNG